MKRKIKDFEFKELMTAKENQNQSKLEKLTYQELHQQEYFTNLKVEQFQMSKSH